MTSKPKSQQADSGSSTRMGLAIALALLFGFALLVANHAGWLTTTVLDTERFVATFEPLPKDDAVSLALAHKTADAVIEKYEVTEAIAQTLPDGIEFIAVPLTTGVRDLTAGVAAEVIRSDAFTTVWTAALTGSHKIATAYVGVLEDGVVVEEEGMAVLDLTEIGAQIAEGLGDRGFDLLEGSDRELKVELFELPDSGLVKAIVDVMGSVRTLVFFVTLALIVAAFAVATDRRRIAFWVGGATVFSMVFSLIDVRYARSVLTGGIEDPIQQAGAEAAWDILVQRLVWQSWAVLLLGAVIMFVAWFLGDSDRAASLRSTINAKSDVSGAGGKESSVMSFAKSHGRLIEWVAAVVIVGFLLVGPPQPIWIVFVLLVILVLVIIGVESVASSASDKKSAADAPAEHA